MKKTLLCLTLAAIMLLCSCTVTGNGTETTPEATSGSTVTEPDSTTAELTATAEITTENTVPGERVMQLIRDNEYKRGFNVMSQKDHANGDKVTNLGVFREAANGLVYWKLAQWDSGSCLWANRVESDPATLTDGQYRTVSYDSDAKSLYLLLDTEAYYQGKGAVQGDYWPHLLAEQDNLGYTSKGQIGQMHHRCDSEFTLSFDIRLTEYSQTDRAGDWVRLAQYIMYFYISGIDSKDFVWFGVQLFDSSTENSSLYHAMDGGKADASGALIYKIGTAETYKNSAGNLWKDGKPSPSEEFVHVEIDLTKYINDMYAYGTDLGYFSVDSLADLKLNGLNFGWETIGTFRTGIEIKNLELNSTRTDSIIED